MNAATLLILAYFLGAIPTGLWIGKALGTDVRQHGSGNLGATNVFRVLGFFPGLATLLLDITKGFLPVHLAQSHFPGHLGLSIAAGLAAIVGHTASVFVRFRGGKGVATSAGVFAALLPVAALVAVITFICVLALTRYVSMSSILAAFTLPAVATVTHAPLSLLSMCGFISVFVLWTHRANIGRLRAGTEPRIGAKRPAVDQPA